MWTLLLACAVRSGPHVDLSPAERRRLDADIRDAQSALNEAPLGPDAPEHRDAIFSAQLALGWEDEAAAQTRLLIATAAPDAPWRRANGPEAAARAEELIEEELRMLAQAWHARARALPRERDHAEAMLAETCALYSARYADNPRAAQIDAICARED